MRLEDISTTQMAWLAVAIFIVLVFAWTRSYTLEVAAGEYPRVVRLNRWTGEVCVFYGESKTCGR